MIKITKFFWIVALIAIDMPSLVYAQSDMNVFYGNNEYGRASGGGINSGGASNPGEFINPLNFSSIQELVAGILKAVIAIGTPIIILAIVYSGFLFIFARGNKETLATAKKNIIWVLVGTAVILGATALHSMIGGTISQIKGI